MTRFANKLNYIYISSTLAMFTLTDDLDLEYDSVQSKERGEGGSRNFSSPNFQEFSRIIIAPVLIVTRRFQ